MKTRKYDLRKNAKWKALFGFLLLAMGIYLAISNPNYSVGRVLLPNVLILAGVMSLFISIRHYFYRKEIKYDEREQMIILESAKGTFSALVYLLLTLMLVGTFQIIKVDLGYFSTGILFFIIFVYKAYYWRLSKKY